MVPFLGIHRRMPIERRLDGNKLSVGLFNLLPREFRVRPSDASSAASRAGCDSSIHHRSNHNGDNGKRNGENIGREEKYSKEEKNENTVTRNGGRYGSE